MPDQEDGDSQSSGPHYQSPGEAQTVPSPKQQGTPANSSNGDSGGKESESAKLERDIRSGERWLIGIGIASVVMNSVIALIYYGQLKRMRKATEDTGIAASAAQQSAKTAKETLTEIQKSSTDTHDLAIAAKDQARAAINQVATLEASVKESHALVSATQESLSVLRNNFRTEQRPYMWAKPADLKFEAGKQILWGVKFVNYGKSPAIHFTQCVVLWVGTDVRRSLNLESLDEKCRTLNQQTASDSIVPPGDDLYTTTASRAPLSEEEIDFVRNTDFRVALMGKIAYDDLGGNHYSSMFCTMHLAAGGALNCPKYNQIK